MVSLAGFGAGRSANIDVSNQGIICIPSAFNIAAIHFVDLSPQLCQQCRLGTRTSVCHFAVAQMKILGDFWQGRFSPLALMIHIELNQSHFILIQCRTKRVLLGCVIPSLVLGQITTTNRKFFFAGLCTSPPPRCT